jgi:Flp pilus assembly protein TadG
MTRWVRRLTAGRLLGAEEGASAVEFAIVFPVFFLLLFGIFEFARAWWAANSLQFAVAQGARYVMTSPSGSGRPTGANCATWTPGAYQTAITTYMHRQLSNWNVSTATPSANPSVNCSASPPTLTVLVSASYTFTFVISVPGLGPSINLHQHATVTTPLS